MNLNVEQKANSYFCFLERFFIFFFFYLPDFFFSLKYIETQNLYIRKRILVFTSKAVCIIMPSIHKHYTAGDGRIHVPAFPRQVEILLGKCWGDAWCNG